MISLNFEGQMLIDFAKMQRTENRKLSVNLINECIVDVYHNRVDIAKEKVFRAYELTIDSCHSAFIAVKGSIPLVANEHQDASNHGRLTKINLALYDVYNLLLCLDTKIVIEKNIISYRNFQLRRIKKILSEILHEINNTN